MCSYWLYSKLWCTPCARRQDWASTVGPRLAYLGYTQCLFHTNYGTNECLKIHTSFPRVSRVLVLRGL